MWTWFRNFLQVVFKIRPDEIALTLIMFIYLQCVVGAVIVGRIARSVFFLEIPDFKTELPYMFIGVAVFVSLAMYVYSRFERSLRRDQTNLVTLIVLLTVTLLSRLFFLRSGLMIDAVVHWFYRAFYIWIEICSAFLLVQFWSLANEIFHTRQAKRLFAVIGAGGAMAGIWAGFGVKAVTKSIGTENLLYVMVALLSVAIVMVVLVSLRTRSNLEAARIKKNLRYRGIQGKAFIEERQQPVLVSNHLRIIAVLVIVASLVTTLVDYQFNVYVADFIPAKEDRSAYFGVFFGATGVLCTGIQFFVTSRLLERFGILTALLLLPLFLLGGASALIVFPLAWALWTSTLMKGSENVLRYTVNDAALQLLYFPVPAAQRGRAKTFIDGILKPLAFGAGGAFLAVFTGSCGFR